MPIYEFQCTDCAHKFEDLVSGEAEKVPCPKCKSDKVLRLISLISAKGISSGCASCTPSSCSSKFT